MAPNKGTGGASHPITNRYLSTTGGKNMENHNTTRNSTLSMLVIALAVFGLAVTAFVPTAQATVSLHDEGRIGAGVVCDTGGTGAGCTVWHVIDNE